MDGPTDQIAGAVFRALTRRGHAEVERAALDAYAAVDEAEATDRERLSRTVFAELLTALDRHLDSDEQVDVLTAAVEDLVEQFSTVIDAAPVAICAVDGAGRIQLWNPAAERTFGLERSAALGQSFGVTWADDTDTADFDTFLDRLDDGERIVGEDARHRRPDGSLVDTRVWAAPLHDGDPGAAFVVLDVTARRGRQQRLAVLNRVLRHNVRNDVNVVRGHVDRLADHVSDDDEARRSLRVARRRLDAIVDLSDTARRIERVADADRAETVRMDLPEVVADRVDRLRRAHPACVVRTSLPDGAAVRAHELLPQALDNVLENAVEHADSATPRVTVDLSTGGGDRVTLRVADDGPGLPPVERRVLETGVETQLTHSTGLGLWLTNWIVRVSSGRIDVETGDEGTTVVLELPAA
ncbi:ATP-binding protein [Haloplanus halophilus]|uniref:ATP-binding protein n=1 Tax=Haloplanus halophilus TaxID=2949993 RepID=UPI00203C4B9E|nr:ATP-binding protein [Haloplanus sp. GDY1]